MRYRVLISPSSKMILPCANVVACSTLLLRLPSQSTCTDLQAIPARRPPITIATLHHHSKVRPRSHRVADVTGLTLIMVDAVKANTISLLETINKLLKIKPDFEVPLGICSGRRCDVILAIEALEKRDLELGEEGMNNSAAEA